MRRLAVLPLALAVAGAVLLRYVLCVAREPVEGTPWTRGDQAIMAGAVAVGCVAVLVAVVGIL